MSSKCDAVSPNVGRYQGTTTNPSSNYATLQTSYVGRSVPGFVSALPAKTESVNRQLLQVIPAYGGVGLSKKTMYGVSKDDSFSSADGEYVRLGSLDMKSNPYCNQKQF